MAGLLLDHAAGDRDALITALDIVQDMHRKRVRLATIPEPVDLDSTQKALAACIIERLVEVYNEPPRRGQHRAPDWCRSVPPSQCRVYLVSPDWAMVGDLNPIFLKRNFTALRNFLMFV